MNNTARERISELIDYFGLSVNAFAGKTGIGQRTLASMFERRTEPSNKSISAILNSIPEVNEEWLLTGRGAMFKTGGTQNITGDGNIATMGDNNKIEAYNNENKPQISYSSGRPYYNVDFIGGFDLVTNDQTINPEYNIDFAPYNKEGVVWCNITGNSMEPLISNGDIIALKPLQDWNSFMEYGKTYAIVTTNDIRTVKKIRKGSDKDHLLLVPENLKEYDEQEIHKSMIMRIFLVMGCMKKM